MRSLGIYFGLKKIGIVEADGKRIISSSSISIDSQAAGAEPVESRAFPLIKEVLRKNLVEAKSACLTIPGKDLIIRTFYLPVLPANEMQSAVRFEVKKYIPFKTEELICDFRTVYDKVERKNLVLFAGIKKEAANRYISLLTQLGLKAESLEYSGFSMLRLLYATGMRETETVAVVNVDIAEDDEVNFVVLENGFPMFDRDIILPEAAVPAQPGAAESSALDRLEKLRTELRISMDFYLRKFPSQAVKKIIFIAPAEMRIELENFAKERSASFRFVDARVLTDRPIAFSTCVFKAYSAALRRSVPLKIAMDLLSASQKEPVRPVGSFGLPALNIDFKFIIIGSLILGLTFFWGQFRKGPVKEDRDTTIAMRPKVVSLPADSPLDVIQARKAEIEHKIRMVNVTMKERVFLTAAVDALPRLIPQGLWLADIAFRQTAGSLDMEINGFGYLGDNAQEIETVNKFKSALKDDPSFGKLFQTIEIERVNQQQYEQKTVSSFRIICRTSRGK